MNKVHTVHNIIFSFRAKIYITILLLYGVQNLSHDCIIWNANYKLTTQKGFLTITYYKLVD